jgi:trimethylguanosine synthase
MDAEAWYEVTPENVARYVARRTSRLTSIVDCFCGVGGNTIQFAEMHEQVVAVDASVSRLAMLIKNARIYGVETRIRAVNVDAYAYIESFEKSEESSCIHMSPPWGGKDCYKYAKITLSSLPVNLEPLIPLALDKFGSLILHLPRNVDLKAIACLLQGIGISYFEVEAVYYTLPQRHLKFFLVFIERPNNSYFSIYEKVREQSRSSLSSFLGPHKSARLMTKAFFGFGLFKSSIQIAFRSDCLRGITRRIISDTV